MYGFIDFFEGVVVFVVGFVRGCVYFVGCFYLDCLDGVKLFFVKGVFGKCVVLMGVIV